MTEIIIYEGVLASRFFFESSLYVLTVFVFLVWFNYYMLGLKFVFFLAISVIMIKVIMIKVYKMYIEIW